MYAGVTALFRARAIRPGVPRCSAAASIPNGRRHQPPRPPSLLQRRCPLHLSASTASSTAAASADTDATASAILPTSVTHTNLARNNDIRYAYRDRTPETEAAVDEMLGTAYVPPARQYPTAAATALSLERARRVARVRVGEEMLLARKGDAGQGPQQQQRRRGGRRRDAADTLGLLQRMTPPRGPQPTMHAMRIVLPRAWDLDVAGGKSVDFVEARTGLAARLRMTSDRDSATAIVLRGQGPVLAKAADELIAACPDVEIFKLGALTSYDYAAQRLWPVIASADDDGAAAAAATVVPPDRLDNIWLHREHQYWIDSAYEKLPRPAHWTEASLDLYVKSLVYGRLRPGVTLPVYLHNVHTDAVRVRLLMAAFEDPAARGAITTAILKTALQFMAAHGGHRAHAERLLAHAERWGVPLDTDAFNILLDGYARTHDARFFHAVLVKMRERCFYPNTRTWLHLLRLVQRDDVRLQVEAAMFDRGLFEDPGARRGVALVTAGARAYQALRAGESLPAFLDKQVLRFGPAWLADEAAADAVLREFFLFHPSPAASKRFLDYRVLVERMAEHGRPMAGSTLNLILEHCAQPHVGDWDTVLWALDRVPAASPDAVRDRGAVGATYRHLVDLCLRTRAASALAAVVFYAVKERALSVRAARTAVAQAILDKDGHVFARAPQLLSRDMAAALRASPVEAKAHAVRGVEAAIRETTAGYAPADRLVDVLRAARALDSARESGAAAAGKTADASVDEPTVTIALVRVEDDDGLPLRSEVRLDQPFDTRRMVVYNQHVKPPWLARRKQGGGVAQTESRDKSSQSGISSSSSPSPSSTQTAAPKEGKEAAASEQHSSGNHPLVQYLNSLH